MLKALDRTKPSTIEIQDWMVSYIATELRIDTEDIDVEVPFERFGLDSSAAIGMTGDLEEWLEVDIDPTLMYDYPTLRGMASYLGSQHD